MSAAAPTIAAQPAPAPATRAGLRVVGLGRTFASRKKSVVAIDDLSFDVAEGAFVAVVGPSGCGKSTLLSILAGLDRPTAGGVWLDGAPLEGPSAERGVVFQRDCLFPWLTVAQNVRYVMRLSVGRGSPHHVEQMHERAAGLIEAVGLNHAADAYPHELSGGMRQRAAIARALLFQPKVLLMDEPFGALDAQTREQMQELLLTLCRRHRTTTVFVTHDVEEAVYLADRVVVLAANPGRVDTEIDVDLPRPRRFAMKLEPRFNELRAAVLRRLHGGAL